ncbi:hypothetical protein BOX15_Mlig013514g1 [Macrostomum lignano]|uniref:Uncharacterized protein n=1 Tax=Macrostomum lignano TaxID=282301 RepID=A0A267G6W2_9PLAT|nr:hypothetical protein BOX15_Mlig027226g1 [Macrostomum lignano]PAA82422.1 hypothetical protein BOX15_Mlig029356g1 [Macrostomum lignano]PAA89280.1 hypothetical protein BOX15_Mlig013514g1 [Macrostomum lignano]
MTTLGKPQTVRLAAPLALLLLYTICFCAKPTAGLPASASLMERRASYWPGMWQFDRSDGGGYGERYYDYYGGARYAKRGYYWPGMWNFDRYYDESSPLEGKRAYYWPGMWRYQQRRPSKRSYGYGNDHPYWLGKACGETGDPAACSILNGLHNNYYYYYD